MSMDGDLKSAFEQGHTRGITPARRMANWR